MRNLKVLSMLLLVLTGFSGCIFHFVAGEEARIQIDNQGTTEIKTILIGSEIDSKPLGSTELNLPAGEKSNVLRYNTLGKFELYVIREADTLSKSVEILGRSYRLVIGEETVEWRH